MSSEANAKNFLKNNLSFKCESKYLCDVIIWLVSSIRKSKLPLLYLSKLKSINNLRDTVCSRFLESHQLEIKLPKMENESRRRKNKGGGGGAALYWALAIKGTFLAMAYNGIAVMSGIALIMGKMALLLTAILGLKKLVSPGDKTTVEIVKKPKYSESHVYSTSFEHEDYHKSHQDRADNISKILRSYL